MSDLNVEYVESVVKLGLIERKKQKLADLGDEALLLNTDRGLSSEGLRQLRSVDEIDMLMRDSKKLRQIAEQIVKASRE